MYDYSTIDNKRWKNFYHFDRTLSTNSDAEVFIEKGVTNGIVIAEEQTAGRGRIDKSWYSPPGKNIYVSFFGKTDKEPVVLSKIAALAAVKTIKSFTDKNYVHLKWPNDILVSMKKVCGVLGKIVHREKSIFYVIGIGINLETPNKDSFSWKWEPGSLSEHSKKSISKEAVFQRLINELDICFNKERESVDNQYYRSISWMIGKKALISHHGGEYLLGTIESFSVTGDSLKFKTEDQREIWVTTGSILSIK